MFQNPPTFLRYRYLSVTVHQHVSDLSLSISVSSDLHHLLAGGLATEIPQLAKVVVEGMLPGDLHAVFFGSANRCPEKRLFLGWENVRYGGDFLGKYGDDFSKVPICQSISRRMILSTNGQKDIWLVDERKKKSGLKPPAKIHPVNSGKFHTVCLLSISI